MSKTGQEAFSHGVGILYKACWSIGEPSEIVPNRTTVAPSHSKMMGSIDAGSVHGFVGDGEENKLRMFERLFAGLARRGGSSF